jgi:hypothetical protein
VTGGRRILFSWPNTINQVKEDEIDDATASWKEEDSYRILVRKPEEKRPLGRPRRRWVDNIKMDLREIGRDVRGLIWLRKGISGG